MSVEIVRNSITEAKLEEVARDQFGDFVKAVIDVEKGIMAIGGELHADEEAVLMAEGSEQNNLWGINIYPGREEGERIEFDSMINVRPSQGNRSRNVENGVLREKIKAIVKKLVS